MFINTQINEASTTTELCIRNITINRLYWFEPSVHIRMKDNIMLAVIVLCIAWLWQPIESDVVQIKPTAALLVSVKRSNDNNASASNTRNDTSPCDRYLRSVEAEVRNPRNHKFVTSNGWMERHRPRPEINVYSRIEELPSPQPAPTVAAYYQQQRDSFYHNSAVQQLPPAVRTSKRIIYYATLPDVIRPPTGYPSPSSYSSDPFALGPGPFSADFRQLDFNRYSLSYTLYIIYVFS